MTARNTDRLAALLVLVTITNGLGVCLALLLALLAFR
jgi:hypothetical protein